MSSTLLWSRFSQREWIDRAKANQRLVWVASDGGIVTQSFTEDDLDQLMVTFASGSLEDGSWDPDNDWRLDGEVIDGVEALPLYQDDKTRHGAKLLVAANKGVIKLVPFAEQQLRLAVDSLSEDVEELMETVSALAARLEEVENG